jgi:superfamily II DNA or RNA helicase
MSKSCKIIIKDEVNAKLDGVTPEDRRALTKRFSFEIPGARYLPAVRLGRWDGKVSYFSVAGSTFINLLPEIIPFLDERGYDVELEDLRDYSSSFAFNTVDEDTFSHKVWPTGHPVAGQPVVLRDYQISVVNNFLTNTQSIQEVATGAGKTLITAALSYSCESFGRTIIIVPNKSLVAQTEADYRNLGLDVGVYYGDRKEFGKTHTICTWQSLNNLLKNTKSGADIDITIGEFIEGVVAVIVDETHQAKAAALKELLTGVMSQIPIRWGLTGTIPKEKFESTALFVSIGPLVSQLSASTLQDAGILAQCHVNVVQLQDGVEFRDYQSELKYLLENEARLDAIAALIEKIRTSGNTLVLVDRIAPGETLASKIADSVFVSGNTKLTERKEEYDEVATSSDKVIIATYGVAAVGINLPRIFNLVLIEPGKSFVRTIQSIGRGLRKAEDKDEVVIYDITSSAKFAKRHLTKRKEFYKSANYPYTVEKLNYR